MPRIRTAHKFSEKQRTGDVLTDELVDFKSLLLSPDVLKGLNSSGFERPSPIQLKAIPLGRCGLDLIAQAKSGTGKTCVFGVIALESVLPESNTTQVLILAPTREIAVQIKDVITAIGSQMNNVACHVFIGGLPVDENKKMLKKPCHIAVGTPGRIKYLIENHFLKTESVRLFILDEADKLLEDNFQEQINWIFSSLPSNKQMMAFSATYPEYLAKHLTRYMREPTFVRLNATDPTLQGIKQFYQLVPFHPLPHKTFQEKVTELLKLLSSLPFHQCLVFSNYQIRAQSLCDTLRLKGWPSVFIAGSQTQSQRLKAMERLKQFKCRVLISTDLTSRGIDAENVNLVVNMDVPRDSETYLHRIGRAGRFGTQGVAVTFVARGEEDKLFRRIEENIGTTVDQLPDPIPQSLGTNGTTTELNSSPLQPRTASIEVEILKDESVRELEDNMNLNSSHLNTNQNSTRNSEEAVDAGSDIVCIGNQIRGNSTLTEQESLKTNVEIHPNHVPPQKVQSKNIEMEEIIADIQEKLQKSLCLDQNCEEEKINGDEVHQNVQGNCDVNQPQRNETEIISVENFQDTSEVSISHDLKENELKTDYKPSSPFALSAEVKASMSKLQVDLTLASNFDSVSSHEETTNILNKASEGRVCTKPSKEDETVTCELDEPSEVEGNLSSSLSEGENDVNSSSESEECSDGLEFDVQGTSETTSREGHFLPSVEEFEKDFEEYLENVSYGQESFVENHSHQSELKEDDSDNDGIQSEETLHFAIKNNGYDKTPGDAFNALPDTYHQMLHQDSGTGNHNVNCIEAQNQPFLCDSDDYENIHPEGGWNYLDPYNGFCDGYFWFNNNDHNDYYHDQSYDNYYSPHHGNYSANWPANAQRPQDSASAQQYLGHFYEDVGNYQDYQWNTSWYNAYQRQTSCIRQFVSFSRSVRL